MQNFSKKYFRYFIYFYSFLKYRIFIAFALSFLIGVLDGFGLTMFIPLLKLSSSNDNALNQDGLGNLGFLPEFLNEYGISLNISNALFIILIFFTMKGVFSFIEGFTRVKYQQLFMREIRVTNIKLLNSFKFENFVNANVGKIQNTFTVEVERVNLAYRSYFKAIEYGVLVMVYISFAISANFKFALIVAFGGIISNFLFKWLFKKTKVLSYKFNENAHKFQNLLIQNVTNFKYLKASGLNQIYGKKLIQNITRLEGVQRKIGIIDSTLRALREPIIILIVVIAILIQVNYFNADIGLLILSLVFLYRALTFLMALQEHWNRFLEVSASMDNMKEFSNELMINKEKNGILKFNSFSNKINLKDVCFNYEGQSPILGGLTFDILKHESIAIIGESGSGKSTIMNLLSGLFDPTNGEIRIDGELISNFDLVSLRNKIGYITQESPIFADTIFNNITFWDEKSSENIRRFNKVLKQAELFDFVYSLPNKEEEVLGYNGMNISGGQKQRVAIARELYKDVEFLFLDEATSALDGDTEASIQANLDTLKGKYTIIIIAHRLSTIKNVDRIILIENGKIELMGTFTELFENSIKFKKMVQLHGIQL